MDYTYNTDIPFADNNPSDDQPLMQVNTNSIAGLIGEDLQGFNSDNNFGGLHLKSRYISGTNGSLPTGTSGGVGTAYSNFDALNIEQLLFTNGASGNAYQLTRAIPGSFAQFATNNTYGSPSNPPILIQTGGWTFLPGGLLFQYGVYRNSSSGEHAVPFPVSFTNAPFIVQISQNSDGVFTSPTFYSATSFTTIGSIPGSLIVWSAIGI